MSSIFAELPERAPLSKHQWLMQIHDVFLWFDEMKAGITSGFGRILKTDSTKKGVKKLTGYLAKTARWWTNVGNEQILTSVKTTGEGHGLTQMLVGVMKIYQGPHLFSRNPLFGLGLLQSFTPTGSFDSLSLEHCDMADIWHFMSRIATGCTTDSHQLYSSFMGPLRNCIFRWG